MARIKKTLSMEVINQQIEEAQEAVIRAKKKYDEATDQLKALLEKRKELQTVELMSQHSYEEIIRFIKSDKSEEEA